jgi:zinc and cadmium transporter
MFFPIFLLFIISSVGLLLYGFKKVNSTLLSSLVAIGAGSMLAVALVHILPESLEQNESAIYTFLAGFVVIYLIEEFLTPHSHDHTHQDHIHEDPHEHFDHIAIVSALAIIFHTLFDGLGIRAGIEMSEELGYAILFGVAIHQIPVSLWLAALFQRSHLKKSTQMVLLGAFAVSAPLGYILSGVALEHIDSSLIPLVTAFAGGSLLYIATSDLLPMIHSTTRKKYLMISCFLLWVIGMSLGHGEHEHGVHDESIQHETH